MNSLRVSTWTSHLICKQRQFSLFLFNLYYDLFVQVGNEQIEQGSLRRYPFLVPDLKSPFTAKYNVSCRFLWMSYVWLRMLFFSHSIRIFPRSYYWLRVIQPPLSNCLLEKTVFFFWKTTQAVVVWSLSCIQLFAIPWIAARQSSLSFTVSWSLLTLNVH